MNRVQSNLIMEILVIICLIVADDTSAKTGIWPYQSNRDIVYLASQLNHDVISKNKEPYSNSANIFLNPIVFYQKHLSRSACQYFPSCSRYTYRAIEKYGPAKGFIMAADRLIRCSHQADQSRYYQIGPYFYDYPFDVFEFNRPIPYEDSYEYHLASIILSKLDFAFYPANPVFKPGENSSSSDSLLVLFPENLMHNSLLKFAVYLYQEQEFFQAATEFKRYLNEDCLFENNINLRIRSKKEGESVRRFIEILLKP